MELERQIRKKMLFIKMMKIKSINLKRLCLIIKNKMLKIKMFLNLYKKVN